MANTIRKMELSTDSTTRSDYWEEKLKSIGIEHKKRLGYGSYRFEFEVSEDRLKPIAQLLLIPYEGIKYYYHE